MFQLETEAAIDEHSYSQGEDTQTHTKSKGRLSPFDV